MCTHTNIHIYKLHLQLLVQADPEDWSVDQVCEWLDQIGLGYYTTTFRGVSTYNNIYCIPHIVTLLSLEHQIDGSALCSLDMQMFGK